jgi:peptidylprolyl isomerase
MREIWISLGFILFCGVLLIGSLFLGNPQPSDAIAAEATTPVEIAQAETSEPEMTEATTPEATTAPEAAAEATAAEATEPEVITTESGLQYIDLVEGDGKVATDGQIVFVHYTGTLENGKKFDSSRDRGQPFSFVLGQGRVIRGWDEGIVGMKVGGQRKLIIPSDLAYGERGVRGVIPRNATLIFDVELLDTVE